MQVRRLCIDEHLCLVDFEINFNTIAGGSTTILIGENGAGKSTMLEVVLEILMSFDSSNIEKQINYNYMIEYEYAQELHIIIKDEHRYCIETSGFVCEGQYNKVRKFVKQKRIFPERVIAFYSGANDKISFQIAKINKQYNRLYAKTLKKFLEIMNDDSERFLPNFPKRKYNYCAETLVPIYLASILCGRDSFEKNYLVRTCFFTKVIYIDMIVNMDKVERIFGRNHFEEGYPVGLFYLIDFIDYRFTDVLRKGFLYSARGKAYFEINNLNDLDLDAISILDFFEKLQSLFGAQYEVTVAQGESMVKCSKMSEGQRQLIKILGMLGICKTEDCIVLMDEPDAHMNPRWKYEIKDTIDHSLEGSINTQAIIATHDPLVINGVSKEFIRIFNHNQSVVNNNGYYIAKVIVPTEDTEGLGIDGLLQSEYYGLPSVLDSETRTKMEKKYELLVKKNEGTITETESKSLAELTDYLENMMFARNIPTDSYYDEYVAAMHKIYNERPNVKLSAKDIADRNKKAEEILKGLLMR